MILVNKFVLSSYDFNAKICLMLYQNLFSVIIVSALSLLGIISTEPRQRETRVPIDLRNHYQNRNPNRLQA
ncbi:hypothetical protein RchiOBHm_Chr2g0126421 [Rosa chinensis]|uniref:Uncharacterized protein n=1 Tax=Rosa chinensis TaxID=74649 RepID=A0A2P6RTU9_ROSCH|nr:hypothetical protein RchiOBHm_Chr2g0126421 [Rosa chinensis]